MLADFLYYRLFMLFDTFEIVSDIFFISIFFLNKLRFSLFIFRKKFIKKRFPLFDDSICEILEKCSIDKQNNKTKVQKPPSRNPRDFCISLD